MHTSMHEPSYTVSDFKAYLHFSSDFFYDARVIATDYVAFSGTKLDALP